MKNLQTGFHGPGYFNCFEEQNPQLYLALALLGKGSGLVTLKNTDEDVKIGVIFALAPSQVQNHCHLNSHILKSYAQVRTMLFDYC